MNSQSVLSHLSVLLNLIISNYFDDSVCLVHYNDNSMDLIRINQPVIIIDDMTNLYLNQTYQCKSFLIQSYQAKNAFEHVEYIIKTNRLLGFNMYHDRRYLIVINNNEEFWLFFKSDLLKFVRDILVIFIVDQDLNIISNMIYNYPYSPIDDFDNSYNLYTHEYIGIDANNDIRYLDTWFGLNSSFELGNSLFPDKVSDQQGRILRAPCPRDSFYATCYSDPPKGNNYNLVLEYAKRFNYTLHIDIDDSYLQEDGYRGFGWIHNSEYRGEGLLGYLLLEDDDFYIDIFYYGYLLTPFCDNVKTVSFYYEVTVPIPRLNYGLFMFVEAFEIIVWVCIFVALILIRLVIIIRQKYIYPGNYSTFSNLSIYGYLLNQPGLLTVDVNRSKLLKYLVMLLLVFNILLVTAYTSRLASVMVEPVYEKDINTLDELAASDLQLLFFDNYSHNFMLDTRQTYNTLYLKSVLISSNIDFELSKILLDSRKYAVARFRRNTGEYYEYAEHLEQMQEKFKPIKPELFTDYYYIILRQNSMHTKELLRLIATANEAGLNQFWQEDLLRSDGRTFNASKYQENPVKEPGPILNLHHLKGVFLFGGCGLFISFIVFIVELFTYLKYLYF